MYLASMLLVWVAFSAAWNFIALRIEDQGGNPLLVGLGLALGGAAEVPMMLLSSPAMRRFGIRAVYVYGACVYGLGFLIWGLVSSPVLISLASVFEGLGVGFLFTSGVVIVGKLLPRSLYSSGQALAGTVAFGIAPIIGGQLGGFMYGTFGSVTLYVVASALAFRRGSVRLLGACDARPDRAGEGRGGPGEHRAGAGHRALRRTRQQPRARSREHGPSHTIAGDISTRGFPWSAPTS